MNETKADPAAGSYQSPKRHLLIAGTGRAGTSFLVRYLTELGLDTTLSRSRDGQVMWDDTANAGLEEIVSGTGENLPYVVKSPWIGQYFEQILANPHIAVDAILIPVRDLVEAATSRTVLEMRAMHESAPWMAELDQSWEVWGTTPGGVVYSVNPLDQARLLAVSFHDLIWRAARAEIPIHFLAFPKIIEDKQYLFRALQPVLPPEVTPELAYSAHERIADPAKVRVGGEEGTKRETSPTLHRGPASLRHDEVDMLALRRELARVRAELSRVSDEAGRSASEAAGLKGGSEGLQSEVSRLKSEVAALVQESARLSNEASGLRVQAERAESKAAKLQISVSTEQARAEKAEADFRAVTESRTWRATGPVRAALSAAKGISRR
ncbi:MULTISPECIES: hypothetical protein [Rhizobium]|uniref:Sulfotransferase family protein n=1 Tax=Rhizobium rhododendri TaxID=2506430 RepID=A0ABY8IM89_9HYPH|nr:MULTISPECIES: hypothetical protein [Rhizobium]MBZ5758108.1 hypothetical protein [Rhizobium sp. VS19-DR96]MBZ5765062.1 hypothetical protein [Rhizobium sp. VS19-DR129.2]MBZ5772605.1 hypothetical protein [Rhizobium sp. VS19-DRK62.2]MBZ5782708.1 hypothetical protein [Rhizobium sp. VS19-DR121]MBZ5800156.1 hypothetical protein [Rhizobium sp. VS19-DR181]